MKVMHSSELCQDPLGKGGDVPARTEVRVLPTVYVIAISNKNLMGKNKLEKTVLKR